MTDAGPSLRIDKWLWHARFCKTRAIAQTRAESGLIRLNDHRVEKTSAMVRVGDTLTIPTAREAMVVRVRALGARRGPPAEARALYEIVPSETPRKPLPPDLEPDAVAKLFREHDYLTAYRIWTDRRVAHDPQDAVGGKWEEIGALQFEYLVANGLKPGHTLLDIGCGTLRGGRHFIRYLEPGHYAGIDLSPAAIASAGVLIREEGLGGRQPTLFTVEDGNLRFEYLNGRRFDFVLAQSVFTHLPLQSIEECFAHLSKAMDAHGVFYFTFFEAAGPEEASGFKQFRYRFETLVTVATRHGVRLERRPDYAHPRRQRMVAASLHA